MAGRCSFAARISAPGTHFQKAWLVLIEAATTIIYPPAGIASPQRAVSIIVWVPWSSIARSHALEDGSG